MLLKKIKGLFGPKVCGELYAQLEKECQQLEMENCRQEIKLKAVLKKNQVLSAQILDWHARYKRLKLTFTVAMTQTPEFQDYRLAMTSMNEEIEHLERLVHELTFKNSELEQSLEKSTLEAKSIEWCDSRCISATERQTSLNNRIPSFENSQAV